MNRLNKSNIGLGEVRNRVLPTIEEYNILTNKVSELTFRSSIEGIMSTLDLDDNVYLSNTAVDPLNTYVIDLSGVNFVRISVDVDFKKLILTGGAQAKTVIFEFINTSDYDVQWINLRVPEGLSPGLTPTNSQPVKTLYEITRIGNEYYLTNELYQIS